MKKYMGIEIEQIVQMLMNEGYSPQEIQDFMRDELGVEVEFQQKHVQQVNEIFYSELLGAFEMNIN